jgi:hypothetical protein
MKMSPISAPWTNKPEAPIKTSLRNFFRVAHGELGGDPATDAVADEIELVEFKRVDHFEIVKDHVFDHVNVFVLVALGAAGMGRAMTRLLFASSS